MLSVILTILKIIGIILLVIIGLLLTVTLTVLFVPIKYQSDGSFKKLDDGFKDNISVRVTWILQILSVSFRLTDTTPEFVIKIFGRPLSLGSKNDENKSKKTKKKDKKVTKKTKKLDSESKGLSDDMNKADKAVIENKENHTNINNNLLKQSDSNFGKTKDNLNTAKDTLKNDSQTMSENIDENETKEKKSIKEKVFSIKQKLIDIWNKIDAICQKIKNVNSIKNEFVEYIKKEESKLAIRKIKTIIFEMFKKLLPRKFNAKFKFGFEDPSTTGKILGISSIFYGIYGDNIELEADFDNVVLEGEYKFKGKIRLINIVTAAIKIILNKWFRQFIKFSKKTIKKI